MSEVKVLIRLQNGEVHEESLYSYCARLSKKNNSILYKLENYLDQRLLDNGDLAEIRDIILTVSADISKLHDNLKLGDEDEGL
jgi:hypothetical protein